MTSSINPCVEKNEPLVYNFIIKSKDEILGWMESMMRLEEKEKTLKWIEYVLKEGKNNQNSEWIKNILEEGEKTGVLEWVKDIMKLGKENYFLYEDENEEDEVLKWIKFILQKEQKDEVLEWSKTLLKEIKKNEGIEEVYDILSKPDSELYYIHLITGNKLDYYKLGIRNLGTNRIEEYELHCFCDYFVSKYFFEV